MANIITCAHCEEKCAEGNRFCKNCNDSKKRREMCEANNAIRKEKGMPPYDCPFHCLTRPVSEEAAPATT